MSTHYKSLILAVTVGLYIYIISDVNLNLFWRFIILFVIITLINGAIDRLFNIKVKIK